MVLKRRQKEEKDMKAKIIIMLALAVMILNGCGKNENKASGETDMKNGVSSNIEVEVGQ